MWRDVCLHNKDAILEMLTRFTEDLSALQKAVRRGDANALRRFSPARAKSAKRLLKQDRMCHWPILGGTRLKTTNNQPLFWNGRQVK